jgi:hypothetical protein
MQISYFLCPRKEDHLGVVYKKMREIKNAQKMRDSSGRNMEIEFVLVSEITFYYKINFKC